MSLFKYKARNAKGELVTGELEAENQKQASQHIVRQSMTPISFAETQPKSDLLEDLNEKLNLNQPTLTDLALFSRQMYSLSKAGVPIIRAIASLAESTRNPSLAKAMLDINRHLEGGLSLSQAMQHHKKIFPSLFISIINIGESAGSLDQAFLEISQYLNRERETQSQIKSALRYPVMVIVAISIAMAVVNVYVIPAFKGVFDKMGAELPWQTQLLIDISDFTVAYWWYILASLAACAFGTIRYINTPEGELLWHKWLLKIPVIGSIIERATMERFSRSFAMTLNSGVPLIQGISLVAEAIGNAYIGSKLDTMRIGIEKGDSISRMAKKIGMFPGLVIQMIMVGEETGNISEMLLEVADFYEAEIDEDLKALASAIEPFLLVIIGIMVLVLALGIFLPMWNLSGAMK